MASEHLCDGYFKQTIMKKIRICSHTGFDVKTKQLMENNDYQYQD